MKNAWMLGLLGACAHQPVASTPRGPGAEGVTDPALAALLDRHWEWALENNPLEATLLGDHRYDDRMVVPTPEWLQGLKEARRAFREQAQALPEDLSAQDKITRALFIEELDGQIAAEVCKFEQWSISPRGNPMTDWNELAELHPVKSIADADNLLRRYRLGPAVIDAQIARLQEGAAQGAYAQAESVRRVLKMLDDQLAQPVATWPMLNPLKVERADWPAADKERFSRALTAAVEKGLKPALERYRDFVRGVIQPKARGPEAEGIGHLPFGAECYRARIQSFTTLPLDAQTVHQTGLSEIKRINAEMENLGKKLFGTPTLAESVARLRTDKALYFTTAEEVKQKAEQALAKAKAAIPNYFGVLPKADCTVVPIPDYEAPFTTIAYYRQPVPDGSRPGQYYVNLYQPETRTRYEAEALAFHESIPGHHLQIAISQELPALPAFRKHGGMTVFVEGWALYTEQLAEEMGLYSGDLDKMGMLSYEAWRAARLVVDTGIHAMGWTRAQAKEFMAEHTALALNNIDNEVDRYIVWPGQALAYKTGQMEIWRLRREAEAALGAKFDLKKFHDAVLTAGAVSLPVLRDQLQAWIKTQN